MVNEGQTVIGKFKGLFSKKRSPEDVCKQLRTQEQEIARQLRGLEYDQRRNRKERDRVIQKGVNAARNGDSAQKKEAAYDLKAIKAEIAQMDRERQMLVKSRLFCKMSLRRLERVASGASSNVIKTVGNLLNDETILEMLTDAKVTEDQFYEKLSRRLGVEIAELEDGMDQEDGAIKEEMELFDSAAESEGKGDETKAKETYSKLTGESDGKVADMMDEL